MIAKLFTVGNRKEHGVVNLDHFPVLLGRSPDAEVHLTDRWVSRRHCQIDVLRGRLWVRDVGSRHGTLVNDAAVNESPLMPGDILTMGLSSFCVDYKISDGEREEHPCHNPPPA
jgi:pSer/pThr/pTyr-binding forkhead associated (FHA) protein